MAQDTIVKQSDGSVHAVKIIEIRKESNLMIYEVGNEKKMVDMSTLKSYVLHSDLQSNIPEQVETGQTSGNPIDTIIKSDGTVLQVDIIDIRKDTDVLIYNYNGKRTIVSLSSLQTYKLHSSLDEKEDNTNTTSVSAISEAYFKPKKVMQYEYGLWSLSTNLTALMPVDPMNVRMTIEPEYEINSRFSVKFPLMIGLAPKFQTDFNYAYTYLGYGGDYFSDYIPGAMPEFEVIPNRRQVESTVVQAGVNPKYYFNHKSKNIISFYGGLALNVGIADAYSMRRYDRVDTTGYMSSTWNGSFYETEWRTYWQHHETEELYLENNQFNYFNYEVLLGFDFNFSQHLTATFEMGFSSTLYSSTALATDKVYTAIHNENNYVQTFDGRNVSHSGGHMFTRGRLLLTYRFGGKRLKAVNY
jgi:hypothetical protein